MPDHPSAASPADRGTVSAVAAADRAASPLRPADRAATVRVDPAGFDKFAREALTPSELLDAMPLDFTNPKYRKLLEPFPSPDLRPPDQASRPARKGRRSPAVPDARPLDVAVPPATTDWVRAFRRSGRGEISLRRVLRLLGRITVGDLAAAGLNLRLPAHRPLNSLAPVVVYVGSNVAATFDVLGDVLEVPIGSEQHRWNQHLWRVTGIPVIEELRPGGAGMPGIFFAFAHRYVVIGAGDKPDLSVREGRYALDVELTDREREGLAQFGRRPLLFVVSPSCWRRRSIPKALAGAPVRLWQMLRCSLPYVREALARRLAATTAPSLLADSLQGVFTKLTGLPLPGEFEEMIDSTIRQSLNKAMAIAPATNVDNDLDVAARLIAPEIADAVVGRLAPVPTGRGRKQAGKPIADGGGPRPTRPGAPEPGTTTALRRPGGDRESPAAVLRHAGGDSPPTPEGSRATARGPVAAQPPARTTGQRATAPPADPGAAAAAHAAVGRRAIPEPRTVSRDRGTVDAAPVRPDLAALRADIGEDGMRALTELATSRASRVRALPAVRSRRRDPQVLVRPVAHRRRNAIRAAVSALKGRILELYAQRDPQIAAIVEEVRRTAAAFGVDPETVHLSTAVTDRTERGRGQLTDMSIIGFRRRAAARPPGRYGENQQGRKEVVLFGIVEVKVLGQADRAPAQIEQSRARWETGSTGPDDPAGSALSIGGERFGPEQVLTATDFRVPAVPDARVRVVVALPADVDPNTIASLERRLGVDPDLPPVQRRSVQIVPLAITDRAAQALAEWILADARAGGPPAGGAATADGGPP